MKSRFRILFLPKWYPGKVLPANGNFIEVHAKAVSQYADVAVLFVAAAGQNQLYDVGVEKEKSLLTVKVYFRKPSSFMFWAYPIRYFKSQLKGYKIIKTTFGKVDASHVHVLKRSCFFALYLKLFKGIPYLISEHWSGYALNGNKTTSYLATFIRNLMVINSERLTAVSQFLRDAMIRSGIKAEYSIVPNAVDTKIFHPKAMEVNQITSLKFIHVSNLEEDVKNVGSIIDAFSKVIKDYPSIELHLIGDGKDRPLQEKKVQSIGLQNSVIFHGDIPREEVASQMKLARALIIFSVVETQSVVMLEALCCGTPVIARAVGGIPEHLNTERGILIQSKDVEELANAMRSLLSEKVKFDSTAISQYGLANFSYDMVGSQFNDIYKQILTQESQSK